MNRSKEAHVLKVRGRLAAAAVAVVAAGGCGAEAGDGSGPAARAETGPKVLATLDVGDLAGDAVESAGSVWVSAHRSGFLLRTDPPTATRSPTRCRRAIPSPGSSSAPPPTRGAPRCSAKRARCYEVLTVNAGGETGTREWGRIEAAEDRVVLSAAPGHDCSGYPGTYRWTLSGDRLKLDPVSDPCPAAGATPQRRRALGAAVLRRTS